MRSESRTGYVERVGGPEEAERHQSEQLLEDLMQRSQRHGGDRALISGESRSPLVSSVCRVLEPHMPLRTQCALATLVEHKDGSGPKDVRIGERLQQRPSPIPGAGGVYGSWFRRLPPLVDASG